MVVAHESKTPQVDRRLLSVRNRGCHGGGRGVTDRAEKAIHICGSTATSDADEKACEDCGQTIYSTNSGFDTENAEWSADLSEAADEQIFVCLKCGLKRKRNQGVAG